MPPDLQRLLDDIDEADRRADAIAASCSDQQFYWQPRQGQAWSIAQCLDHLGTMNIVYGNAIAEGIERALARGIQRRGPAAPGLFGGLFVKSLEPPVTRRLRAPRAGRPAEQKPRAAILDGYHLAHQRIRILITRAAEIDANRAFFLNPFIRFVRVRVATGFNVVTAHDRRHLWQAEQVQRDADFPRSAPF
jgi:hypothetical protein